MWMTHDLTCAYICMHMCICMCVYRVSSMSLPKWPWLCFEATSVTSTEMTCSVSPLESPGDIKQYSQDLDR